MEQQLPESFLKALAKDPDLVNKLVRRAKLDDFRKKYNVERASPLKCPACASLMQTPGSLWMHKDDKSLFTCRKCKITYRIETTPISTDELIFNLRKIHKGDEEATLDWDKRLQKEKP